MCRQVSPLSEDSGLTNRLLGTRFSYDDAMFHFEALVNTIEVRLRKVFEFVLFEVLRHCFRGLNLADPDEFRDAIRNHATLCRCDTP